MNQITLFTHEEFGSIRTLNIDGEPWFVGRDVAESLKYSNTSKAVSEHVDEEDRMTKIIESTSANGKLVRSRAYLINQSGLFSLILRSKLESAKRFKHYFMIRG